MKKCLSLLFVAGSMLVCASKAHAQVANPTPTTTTPAATTAPAVTPPAPTVITWSGYVKAEYFYDSRQTVNAREGDLVFVPATIKKDANGVDLNANPDFNILAIQSRLRLGITGPEFYGMKTTGAIEGEFLGVTNGDVNGFRLRHAFLQLTDAKKQITMGQTWHPFFVTDCFPGTYGFATGLPFSSLGRAPQFKISSTGKTKVFGAILSERDFKTTGAGSDPTNTSIGANGYSGVSLAAIPVFAFGVSHTDGAITAGATAEFKRIRPSFTNASGTSNTSTFDNLSANVYFKYKKGLTTFKVSSIYGSNTADLLMVGAFAIRDSSGKNPLYTPLKTLSAWADLEGGTAKLEYGIFVGQLTNLGFADNLKTTAGLAGFLSDIKSAVRVAPRIGWKMNKMKIGVEVEYTQATRGSYATGTNKITELAADSKTSNTRILIIGQYNF